MSDEAGSINETSTPTDLTSNNFDNTITTGGSLKLSEDISNASKADISKDTILDLYGHTLTFSNGSDEYGILVKPGATLTITDTSGTTGSIKKVIGTNDNDLPHPVILIGTEDKNATNTEMATLNLQKCNIQTIDANGKSSTAGYGVYAANYSQVTAGEGVTITAGYSAISGNGNNKVASITITGGEYTSETSAAIFFPSTTKLDVTGGTFIGKTGFDIRAGTVTISDAVISLNKDGTIDKTGGSGPSSWGMGIAVIDNQAYASGSTISVSISNTTITGATYDVYIGDLNINTENGAFKSGDLDTKFTLNHKISLEIKDNKDNSLLKYAAESGSSVGRIISSIEGVIEVNSVATLQNAIEVCSGTIKLTKDIDFSNATAPLKFDKKATLDLNGKTLTIKGDARIEVVAGGDLTITDSSGGIGSITYTVEIDERSAISVTGEANNVAKLTLDKCKITVSGSGENVDGYGIFAATYSEITSGEGVTITAGYSAISGNGKHPNVDINITGGEYISKKFAAIYFPCVGNLIISGGNFTGPSGIEIRAGYASISNATITVDGSSSNTVPKSDQPTNWGMGIAILDHKDYAKKNNSDGHLDINVFINNVKFNGDANFDIYVGKSPFDKDQASNGGLKFTQNNEKTVHKINIVVNDVDFEGKGLYLYGANDVRITKCTFKNITTSADSDKNNVNAIYLRDCRDISIENCTINGVSGNEETSKSGRGILVQHSNGGSFKLMRCQISNIAYNAVQIDASSNFDEILIGFNTITNWDSDNTGSSNESGAYAGGRAIRINVGSDLPLTFISLLENTFTKSYGGSSNFVDGLGTTTSTGYDKGNILKITTTGNNTIADVTLAENKIGNSALVMSDENYVIVPASSPGVTFENVSDDKLYEQNVADLADGISISKVYVYNNLPLSDYLYEVSGTLNYLESYPGFSSLGTMQSGYYLPVKINLLDDVDPDKLSITIVGKETKKVVLDDSDKKTLAKGYLNLVLFVTGECESFEITVDFDGSDTKYGPSTYILSLFALEFKGGIKAAPLADQPTEGSVTKITLPGTYEAYISYEGYGYEDIATIKLIAEGVPEHSNGLHNSGYWVGVAIPIPSAISVSDITSAKYYFETTAWNGSIALSAFSANDFMADLYGDGTNYVCFYINTNSDPKQYIVIDWDGESTSQPVKYYVDLSNVKIIGETCNVSYYDGSVFLEDTTVNCGSVLVKPVDPTKSGYNFAGWYVDEELTIAYDFSKYVYNDLKLYAKWDVKSSGSGGGVPVTPPVTPEEPKEPIIPDSKGNAEIKVDEEKADKLVQETVTSGSKTLELINKDSIEGTVTSVTVAVEDLKTISDKIENNQNINSVSIATSAGEVIIEKDVLSDILANTDAETIVVEVVDAKDQLNEEQKKVVGDNPVYDINIRAGSEYITNFNGNSITISIPYELQPGEDPNNLVVYYLKDDGTVEKMKGTYKDGKVSFETNHLSKFVIAYEAQEPVTPDNPDKPAKEDNDNTIYYAIAAIVVILIIVALAYYFLKKKQ